MRACGFHFYVKEKPSCPGNVFLPWHIQIDAIFCQKNKGAPLQKAARYMRQPCSLKTHILEASHATSPPPAPACVATTATATAFAAPPATTTPPPLVAWLVLDFAFLNLKIRRGPRFCADEKLLPVFRSKRLSQCVFRGELDKGVARDPAIFRGGLHVLDVDA